MQQLKIAHLDQTAVAKIRELEDKTGKHIMAFEQGLSFAQMSDDHLKEVQALEEELGIVLVVYQD